MRLSFVPWLLIGCVSVEDIQPVDAALADLDMLVPDARPYDAGVDLGPLEDAAPDAAAPDAGPPVEEGPAVYGADRSVSPITPYVARRLRSIAARAPDARRDVFAKVGASATVSRGFLHCFAGDHVELPGRDELQRTIDFFRGGDAAGTNPFSRESESAVVGWSARSVIAGTPSPIEREIAAIDPRFAVVMFGTNDIQGRDLDRYGSDMLDLTDALVSRGVIPVLSSVMPRGDDADADAEVPGYNGVVRAIAEAHQVPFVDLHRELIELEDHGLAGDRLHPSAYREDGASRACVFTEAGLRHGYNWRNLLTITALHRGLEALDDEPSDPPEPRPRGDGSPGDPYRVTALPYGHAGSTDGSPHSNLDRYSGCDAEQDESGPELIYRLDLERATNIRAVVVDRGEVDIDLHLLADPADPTTCLARAHTDLRASLEAGTWYFALDTFNADDGPRAGDFLFVLVEEPD